MKTLIETELLDLLNQAIRNRRVLIRTDHTEIDSLEIGAAILYTSDSIGIGYGERAMILKPCTILDNKKGIATDIPCLTRQIHGKTEVSPIFRRTRAFRLDCYQSYNRFCSGQEVTLFTIDDAVRQLLD